MKPPGGRNWHLSLLGMLNVCKLSLHHFDAVVDVVAVLIEQTFSFKVFNPIILMKYFGKKQVHDKLSMD
jgi:hypothetical protein